MQSEQVAKATMSEIYAEFDDSDNLEGNDEDIGALGSILSWDEEDDEAVGLSVAATSSALEARELPSSVSYTTTTKASTTSYLPDLSGNNNNNSTAAASFQIPTAPVNYTTTQQPQQIPIQPSQNVIQQQQQQQPTQQQQPQQPQMIASAPGTAAPQQQPQLMFYQMPPAFGQNQQQPVAALPQGITLAAAQQNAFNIADPNAFIRQMQAQQQFNAMQQARPLAPQPVIQQQQQIQPVVQKKPKQEKPVVANIVSCSDTDGETSKKARSGATAATAIEPKPDKGARKKAASADKVPEIDTSNMSATEKAKANRDRNREHARNTRLRKKAYLEKLKMTVDELCRERDTLVSERAGAANLLVEMHNTRTEVLMSFFALRSAYEKRRELWASILDESCFACVMPVTPYRSFPASEVQVSKCQRTILGIDAMMADTASLHVLLNSMVDRSRYPTASIAFRYTLVTEDAVVAGNQMMARWVMSTLNATQCGARMEVAKQGMLCCKFNSAHKIIGLELMFDVMAFMLQLKQAAGSDTFSVVPNTVQTCQRSFDTPMVMTLAERPYTIVQVNQKWEDMTGYKAEEVVGKTSCRVLQGQETDGTAVEALMYAVRFKRPGSCMLVNYSKTGQRFRNYLNVYPLSTDSKVTHYVALTAHVDLVDGATNVVMPQVQAGIVSQQQQQQPPFLPAGQPPTLLAATPQQQQQQASPLVMPPVGMVPGKPIHAPPATLPGAYYLPPSPVVSNAPQDQNRKRPLETTTAQQQDSSKEQRTCS